MIGKAALKQLVGRRLSRNLLEKLTEYVIAEQESAVSLAMATWIDPPGRGWELIVERGREDLWTRTLAPIATEDLMLLEFGVWKGDSLRYFTGLACSPGSRFIGFDSFEGLPEDWRGLPAERFAVQGQIPAINDPRVSFVKGWFQDSLPSELDRLRELARGRHLVVHFDADLYSSTLYLLFALEALGQRYTFIFDEFSGHETRALYNYLQATGARADFHYRLDWESWPTIVSGRLSLRPSLSATAP